MRWLALLVLVITQSAPGYDSDEPGRWPPTPEESIAQAEQYFAEGIAKLEDDREGGERILQMSGFSFDLAHGNGVNQNSYLMYNAGNAYLLAGETGRAIVRYKRAERLLPNDGRVAANLAEARSRVVDRVEASGTRQVARTVFFWHYDIPARWRAVGLIGAWAVVWLGGGWCLIGGWSGTRGWIIAAGAVGVAALGTSLVIEDNERTAQREAVIIADSVIARTGPDEAAYGARFERPLHQGVEVRVEEERAGWVYVRLADGREAWVPASAIERV